jgi:hypothetical protein
MHGMQLHARRFLLNDFVSVENKERLSYFPKLDVAGSIPVARSKSSVKPQILIADRLQTTTIPQNVPQIRSALLSASRDDILRTSETASPSLTKRYGSVFISLAVVKVSLRLAEGQYPSAGLI